jgi:hypothetical protein
MKNEAWGLVGLEDVNRIYQREGLCIECGSKREVDGTKWHCRACADKRNAYIREYRKNRRDARRHMKLVGGQPK